MERDRNQPNKRSDAWPWVALGGLALLLVFGLPHPHVR